MKNIIFTLLGIIVLIAAFFIYTASMSNTETTLMYANESKRDTLNLLIPKNDTTSTSKYKKNKARLTLLLLKNNLIYGYSGSDIKSGKIYTQKDIRKYITEESSKHSPEELAITVMPSESSGYKNIIDILDEMTINNIKKYEMISMGNYERVFVRQFE